MISVNSIYASKTYTYRLFLISNDLGWKYNKICEGDDIFRKDKTFLISLLGDTKEKCEALCNTLPECNLAKFYSASYSRDIYKCIPKTGFKGHCENRYKASSYSSNYTSSLMFYVKDSTGRNYSDKISSF